MSNAPAKKKSRPAPLRCEECNLFLSRARAYEEEDWEDVDHYEGIYRRHLYLVTDCSSCGHTQTIEEIKE